MQGNSSAPIKTNQLSTFLSSCKFPILSGLFAFLAGFAGKHAFSEDIGGLKSYEFLDVIGFVITFRIYSLQHEYAHYAIRGVCAVLMLYFNSLMIKFFIHSLQESGATLTTIMNFSFNFILSVNIIFSQRLKMNREYLPLSISMSLSNLRGFWVSV